GRRRAGAWSVVGSRTSRLQSYRIFTDTRRTTSVSRRPEELFTLLRLRDFVDDLQRIFAFAGCPIAKRYPLPKRLRIGFGERGPERSFLAGRRIVSAVCVGCGLDSERQCPVDARSSHLVAGAGRALL